MVIQHNEGCNVLIGVFSICIYITCMWCIDEIFVFCVVLVSLVVHEIQMQDVDIL